MSERIWIRIAIGCLTVGLVSGIASAQAPAAAQDYSAFVKQYCVTCHSDKLKTGDLSLESVDVARPGAGADVWEKVIRKLRVGMMPPQGAPQPNAAARAGMVSYLQTSLDRA